MKVAIVHEWLTTWAGSEQVLKQLIACFPHADLYTLIDFLPPADRARIAGRSTISTFIQHLPFARDRFWNYLPLMPIAIEQLDLSAYDLVISNSHAFAKGVITGPDQLHLSYVHSPMRYAWDLQHDYLRDSGMTRGPRGQLARLGLHYLRIWDSRTSNGVDAFASNSHFIARRIRKVYGRHASVIYPPVDLDTFSLCSVKESFYLCASRMVPYKKMDLIVQAFASMPDQQLVVIGDGPDRRRIERHGAPNIEFLGHQPTATLRDYLQRAKALIFAAYEDFGILPVEAQACGTPVIAYGRGGARETVLAEDMNDATGLFFYEQSVGAIRDAVREFEDRRESYRPEACRRNAERFSEDRFRAEFSQFVARNLAAGRI